MHHEILRNTVHLVAFQFAFLASTSIVTAESPVSWVVPIDWSAFDSTTVPTDDFSAMLVTLLQRHSKYTLGEVASDYNVETDMPGHEGQEFYYPYVKYPERAEWSIRPLGTFALSTAIMMKTGIYNPEVAGVERAEALRRVELALRGIAYTHRANRKGGRSWGGRCGNSTCWQAAYWASLAGQAAWMMWDELSDDTREVVASMIEYEADSFRDYEVPYTFNSDGTSRKPGDSKSEENAWNARLLALAQAMMPRHPRVAEWRSKASELQISAYARPSDVTNGALVDGKPVSEWVRGWNITENGIVVNHGMVQPDYTACDAELRGNTVVVASLAKLPIPESTLFNARVVYNALTEVELTPGPSPYSEGEIVAPGGTMYVRELLGGRTIYWPSVFYPQGADWVATDRNLVMDAHLNTDVEAEVFGFDNGEDFDSLGWGRARVERMLEMQQQAGDSGALFVEGDWVAKYYSTEQVMFESNASSWLMWWLHKKQKISPISTGWAR